MLSEAALKITRMQLPSPMPPTASRTGVDPLRMTRCSRGDKCVSPVKEKTSPVAGKIAVGRKEETKVNSKEKFVDFSSMALKGMIEDMSRNHLPKKLNIKGIEPRVRAQKVSEKKLWPSKLSSQSPSSPPPPPPSLSLVSSSAKSIIDQHPVLWSSGSKQKKPAKQSRQPLSKSALSDKKSYLPYAKYDRKKSLASSPITKQWPPIPYDEGKMDGPPYGGGKPYYSNTKYLFKKFSLA